MSAVPHLHPHAQGVSGSMCAVPGIYRCVQFPAFTKRFDPFDTFPSVNGANVQWCLIG